MHDVVRRGLATIAVATPFLIGFALDAGASAVDDGDVAFRFTDPDIVESSGLVALGGGRFVTVNDSGDSARVFVVDRATGDTTDVVTWPGEPTDVEALAPAGRDAVWVGDLGDNTRSRDDVSVRRLPLDGGPGQAFTLTYPDGPRDAEALLTDPQTGQLLVVSKVVFGGQVYAAPTTLSTDGPNEMAAVGDVAGIVTDGAFFPDGRHLVLRTYTQAVVYAWPSLESVGSFDLPAQQQGEGIAVSGAGDVFVSSEGQRAPVLEVTLPRDVRAAMEEPGPTAPTTPAEPDPDEPAIDAFARAAADRPVLPWAAGLLVFLGCIAVAVRASRPPR